MTEFGTVIQVGKAYFWRSATPASQGGGASASPKIFGTPTRAYLRQNDLTYSDEILYNTWGEEHVLGHQLHSPPKGAGPQRPPDFMDLLHACAQYEKQQPNFAR